MHSPYLQPGALAPDASAASAAPRIVVFTLDEWDPAQTHLSELWQQMARHFAGETLAPDWQTLDACGPHAARWGVTGKRALFVVDETNRVRWQWVDEGAPIQPGALLAALETLRDQSQTPNGGLSRRTFLGATLAAAAVLSLARLPQASAQAQNAANANGGAVVRAGAATYGAAGTIPVKLRVNGKVHTLQLEPRVALLDALREYIGLTGTKKGCDHGQCGACTVHVDGERWLSCLELAVKAEDTEITTIEGLAQGLGADELHPMQLSFIRNDAFQCGYCTPGQIMSATALLKENPKPTDAQIRESMAGNLCRCAAYPNIVAAIADARDQTIPGGQTA